MKQFYIIALMLLAKISFAQNITETKSMPGAEVNKSTFSIVKTDDVLTTTSTTAIELTETVEEIQQEQVLLADLISLPLPVLKSSTSLEECILKRRSVRQFKNKDLTLEQISQLLWAGQGITDTKNKLKSAPSAGALYPIDLYVVTSKGVFSYTADGHKIARTLRADLRQGLSNACQGQTFIAEAGITIIITATLSKTTWRYGEKGIRFASLEAGHVAQNILLQAVPLKLNAIPVGQFNDKEVKALLELPTEQLPIYIIPIGYQK